MDNEQYINSITLEYLLNPGLYEKISSQKNNTNNLVIKDIIFYRKRISQLTKEMCKGDYPNDILKTIFINYASTMIYYLKQIDAKDIFQSDYENLNLDQPNSSSLSDISNLDNITDINDLLINKPAEINNLDNFVKKLNITIPNKILPQQRIANLKDPALKKKGLKKKISP
jgi:hypothetical protein